uniref:HMG box-containing protein 1 n=1 Tax=Macaca fascicularis TaxID=9541 RepID=A0A7N9DDY8_MACFA
MVWEVKTNQMPNAVQKLLLVMDKRASGMNDSLELLQCNENLPSSPGYNSCDEHMELDDLPELQAVQSDPTQSGMYQLSSDVSHQEYTRPSWNQNTSDIPETTYRENEVDWLTELANIATSPQSPLMQCSFYNRSSPVHIIATSKSLHSYARPPPVSSSSKSEPAFPHHHWKEETPVRHERANSESESGIFCMSSLSDDDDLGWCNSWPSTVWHCFLKGTRLCFHKGSNKEWQDVEDFARAEGCDNEEDLQMGIHNYDFTPMDSSAVYVLSSMARQRRASLSCGGPGGQDFARSGFSKNCGSPGSSQLSSNSLYAKAVKNHSSGTVSATSPNKCKRPMNAFMLFAKKYRVEYTQMYPGKDNRAISVILGDRWKKMKNEERRMYTLEAKALAEEQKRLNPDCWKRKRTNSGSQQH